MTGILEETFVKKTLIVYKTVNVPKESSGQLRPREPFGVGCPGDLAQQGVLILPFIARIFHEILAWQNLKEFFRLHKVVWVFFVYFTTPSG